MAKSEACWQVMNLIVTMKDGMMGMIGMVGMGLDGMGDFGIENWLVVWTIFYFLIFFRGVAQPPSSYEQFEGLVWDLTFFVVGVGR